MQWSGTARAPGVWYRLSGGDLNLRPLDSQSRYRAPTIIKQSSISEITLNQPIDAFCYFLYQGIACGDVVNEFNDFLYNCLNLVYLDRKLSASGS